VSGCVFIIIPVYVVELTHRDDPNKDYINSVALNVEVGEIINETNSDSKNAFL
jgi:hypothetical protein